MSLANPVVTFLIILLIGIVAGLLTHRLRTSWIAAQITWRRGVVTSALVGIAGSFIGYHIGVMTTEQLSEVDWLVGEQGVASFKYYMFYKGLNLTSDSTHGSAYTMAETYDLGHLYLLMREVAAAGLRYGKHGRVSLSLHCEQAELIRVFIEAVKRSGPSGLEGYHRSRPPLTEQLSIAEALC